MKYNVYLFTLLFFSQSLSAQTVDDKRLWHDKERVLRYHPEGDDIVITNGNRRFTRALYGTNTAFRVEAGDLPEFAMYMPGMGGNIKFGLVKGDSSKWLIAADNITARYRAGSMLYQIEDKMLARGKIFLTILALADAEGMIIKISTENITGKVQLVWVYGGATGKKFSRDGDMGPDPESSFYLKPEYCSDNNYTVEKNSFLLRYGTGLMTESDPYINKNFPDTTKPQRIGKEYMMIGIVPPSSIIQIADATAQLSPLQLTQSIKSSTPLATGVINLSGTGPYFFSFQKPDSLNIISYKLLPAVFDKAELARKKIAERIVVKTPDAFINTLGGILGIAADAVWESPTYMHGAIGWRMRLNGWRGPYVADVLGWHDRAKTHFKAYALSQVTIPLNGPLVMDTALHLARSLEKMGTSVFSSGYISRNPNGDFRPHHYDMNLVYIDELMHHFLWTGDMAFAKEMWPVITRHLAWEKRNFDSDGDGLYDAYAAIWASDALQYSGGGVTHSSAYNYKANKEAAIIATLIGEDARPYETEAAKIFKAINTILWMPKTGSYAEFKDLLGNKMLHTNAAVWTLYHSLDSDVPDVFQAYQCMRYIDENIPHIPVMAKGIDDGYATISTSKWMPYDWSLNNVATAEVMHTALAYWQSGSNEKAFNLWKSELLSTMYLGGSAGNIGQISFYDANRGEAYRDFADPIAMTARSIVEGLFGILPNAMKGELVIKPGYPSTWNSASINTPDIFIDFKRNGNEDDYTIIPAFAKKMSLKLLLKANGTKLQLITVNGKIVLWKNIDDAIEMPMIEVDAGFQKKYAIKLVWQGNKTDAVGAEKQYVNESTLAVQFPGAVVQKVSDPQNLLQQIQTNGDSLTATVHASIGNHTVFVQLKQQDFTWWAPLDIEVKDVIEIVADFHQPKNSLRFNVTNNSGSAIKGKLVINEGNNAFEKDIELAPGEVYIKRGIDPKYIIPGTNEISFISDGYTMHQNVVNWNMDAQQQPLQNISLTDFFNDKVTNIFKNQYLSPRPKVATLQLPTQGIGDWTHPLKTADIDDRGLRKLAGENNKVVLPQGVSFSTPSDTLKKNILFTSQWENYPKEALIPLSGKASHAYLLMAGSTNPMQSRMVNGAVIILYTDNTADTLLLKNPESWWPIEQDYMDDGFAFTIDAATPIRIHLKTGKIISEYDNSIENYNGKMIDGGAATVLDMPLQKRKTLKELKLQTIANDVVIGLMGLTLTRE